MPVGNEGARHGRRRRVVRRGPATARQGRRRWSAGRCTRSTAACTRRSAIELPDGAEAVSGAASFVNPMTALGMVGDDASGGPHRARPHRGRFEPRSDAQPAVPRGAASPLVNIVRSRAQVELLRAAGATHVCDTSCRDVRRRSRGTRCARPVRPSPSTPSAAGGSPGRSSSRWRRPLNAGAAFSRYGSAVAQAGLHLRRTRSWPDRARPQLRHGVGRRRLAPRAVPGQRAGPTRSRGCATAWRRD